MNEICSKCSAVYKDEFEPKVLTGFIKILQIEKKKNLISRKKAN